jgi:uncharacterized membrane protein YfcA
MDGLIVHDAVFLLATFAAAVVAGVAGFAFGLIAAAIWLHFLTPVETAALIVGFGLIVQGIAVWKLRAALDWSRLWPFLLGAVFGVPIGIAILGWADARQVRFGVGILLMLYVAYSLARPALAAVRGGRSIDCGVGFFNGVLGGATGLAGILVVIWSGLRGWPKDVQRTVFQPVGVATFALTGLWLGTGRAVSTDVIWLFLLGLPVLLAGTWLGLRLYGQANETGFRRIVLVLLALSGLLLVIPPLRA